MLRACGIRAYLRRPAARLGARRMLIAADPHAVAFYQAAGAVRHGECASASIPGRKLPLLYLDIASARQPSEAPT